MKKFIVEQVLPGRVRLSQEELNTIAHRLCQVTKNSALPSHWVQTFVTDRKLYSVHIAPDVDTIEKNAREGGFPIDTISEVKIIIDPSNGL